MSKTILLFSIIVIVIINFTYSAYSKDLLSQEADKYVVLLNSIEKSKKRQSLEPLYKLSISVQNKIKSNLDKKSYTSICAKMKGFNSMPFDQGEYEIGIYLNPEYFLNISRKKGTLTDIAFFDLYKKTKPEGLWPVYTNQQTDYSGCQIYGKGLLVNLYKEWIHFKARYPDAKAYKVDVNKNISDLEQILTADLPCVCDDKASYIKEMELFLKSFPASTISFKVKSLLNKAKSGQFDNIKDPRAVFQCQSG